MRVSSSSNRARTRCITFLDDPSGEEQSCPAQYESQSECNLNAIFSDYSTKIDEAAHVILGSKRGSVWTACMLKKWAVSRFLA